MNNLKGLQSTINSIKSQSSTNFEIIVIDGGSTDGTLEFLEEEVLIKNWVSEKDNGIYSAMNKGLQRATGTHVIFLNSGDHFLNNDILMHLNGNLKNGICQIYRTKQIFNDLTFIRPKRENLNYLLKSPAHQGFICPLDNKTPLYSERKKVNADMEWMRKCIKIYDTEIYEEIIAIFYLGGVSNYPSWNSIKIRLKEKDYINTFKQLIKFISRKLLGDMNYYRFIYSFGKQEISNNNI